MQRFSGRPASGIFAEETIVAVITPDLRLLGNLPYIDIGDALEERHTLEYRFDRAGIIQLFEEAAYCWYYLHQALHDLLGHLQHYGGGLRAGGRIALLSCQHTMLAHVLTTAQDCHGKIASIWTSRGK